MDGAAPKAKLHPPRRARAPCARVAEGSGASAKHRGKEPEMFAVASGVNAEGEGGASGLGEGPEGCIGGGTAGRGTAGIRSGLAPITCFFWMKNRNSGNDKLNWVSEHLPTSGVNFRQGPVLRSNRSGFPQRGRRDFKSKTRGIIFKGK